MQSLQLTTVLNIIRESHEALASRRTAVGANLAEAVELLRDRAELARQMPTSARRSLRNN
jgi:hypothetical protein